MLNWIVYAKCVVPTEVVRFYKIHSDHLDANTTHLRNEWKSLYENDIFYKDDLLILKLTRPIFENGWKSLCENDIFYKDD